MRFGHATHSTLDLLSSQSSIAFSSSLYPSCTFQQTFNVDQSCIEIHKRKSSMYPQTFQAFVMFPQAKPPLKDMSTCRTMLAISYEVSWMLLKRLEFSYGCLCFETLDRSWQDLHHFPTPASWNIATTFTLPPYSTRRCASWP